MRSNPACIEVFFENAHAERLHDWVTDGYRSLEDYLFWSRKVCGLACLQSLLHGWTDVRLTMGDLLEQALDRGCYVVESPDTVHGLIYRPFMTWVSAQFGFHCQLVEHTPIQDSARQMQPGQVLIASVSPQIREPETPEPRRGGHLVLVHAVHHDIVQFHNPSGLLPQLSLRIASHAHLRTVPCRPGNHSQSRIRTQAFSAGGIA